MKSFFFSTDKSCLFISFLLVQMSEFFKGVVVLTRCIERQHGLDVDIHGRDVEGLKHDLGHALTVGFGVKGSFSEEDRVLLRCNTELVVEGVVPDLLHIVPVGDNSVFNRVLQGKDTSL